MKPFKVNPSDYKELIRAEVEKQLANNIGTDSKIKIDIDLSKLLTEGIEKATVHYTKHAIDQIKALVEQSEEEIGWNATVTRNKNVFTIHEVYVYPQEVTGATTTATDDYGLWLMEFPDEVFNIMRMQGHSHVNFGVLPSVVDNTLYQNIITNTKDFFIFMITNKKGAMHTLIYDIENNLVYDDKDINITYEVPSIDVWAAKEIKNKVTKSKPISYFNKDADSYLYNYEYNRINSGTFQTPYIYLSKKEYENLLKTQTLMIENKPYKITDKQIATIKEAGGFKFKGKWVIRR